MIILLKLLPKRLISRFSGFLCDLKVPGWLLGKIMKGFVKAFKVNMEEAEYPLSHYKTFNQFFTRPIKPTTRPVDADPKSVVSPVDAKIIELGDIKEYDALQIKGLPYSVEKLITEKEFSKQFYNGHFITLYLSPRDYHRIHTPFDGKGVAVEYNRGALFPVNELGLHRIQNLFAINERLTTFFETSFGKCALVKVGATNVGRILTTYDQPWNKKDMKQKHLFHKMDDLHFKKGDELARFELGSTVILLFSEGSITFKEHLKSGLSLKMGEVLATVR